jgi:uncharacterized protein
MALAMFSHLLEGIKALCFNIDEMAENVKIVLFKDITKLGLKKPKFIIGFPTIGLVGSISLAYLTSTMDFEFIGTIRSSRFAPVVAIHDHKPIPPLRIMVSSKSNLVAVVSEMSIPMTLSQGVSDAILSLFKEMDGEMMVVLGGISLGEKKDGIYYIPSTDQAKALCESKKVGESIKEGATTGVTALLIMETAMKRINAVTLLAEANPDISDPKASSNILKSLSRLIDLPIKTAELDREAREIGEQVKETELKSAPFRGGDMYR